MIIRLIKQIGLHSVLLPLNKIIIIIVIIIIIIIVIVIVVIMMIMMMMMTFFIQEMAITHRLFSHETCQQSSNKNYEKVREL